MNPIIRSMSLMVRKSPNSASFCLRELSWLHCSLLISPPENWFYSRTHLTLPECTLIPYASKWANTWWASDLSSSNDSAPMSALSAYHRQEIPHTISATCPWNRIILYFHPCSSLFHRYLLSPYVNLNNRDNFPSMDVPKKPSFI